MDKVNCAIIGSGNIGTDLMIKIIRISQLLEINVLAGIDSSSDGLACAKRMDVTTTSDGLAGLQALPEYKDIQVVFDATSAGIHEKHSVALVADGKQVIDLTPAAIGPYTVPPVNIEANLVESNVNMVTCGGQATIPMVAAVNGVTPVIYGEIVASIASKSAGAGTRANIDEFTETTARAIEQVGGAQRGKAVIILNPAEPPLMMRDTIYCLCRLADQEKIRASIHNMVREVQSYVPGYRLKQEVQFEHVGTNAPLFIPEMGGKFSGLKVSIFLEVEGAAHYLPAYAGNLDIMTSAALKTAERLAIKRNWV
ncbi:MAG: acetaldehyde dehydrogenase (acetylating) [Aestuariivita sp.]|nr:acetaldehyde dehydrogenase (acetylating) [Aestuariivita sp.]